MGRARKEFRRNSQEIGIHLREFNLSLTLKNIVLGEMINYRVLLRGEIRGENCSLDLAIWKIGGS